MARFLSCHLKNESMVVYIVSWQLDSRLSKGKGRCKNICSDFAFSVLCRSKADALSCLNYYFKTFYVGSQQFDIDDGVISLRRSIVDSRNVNVQFLIADGIPEPIQLSDLKGSLNRLSKYFSLSWR